MKKVRKLSGKSKRTVKKLKSRARTSAVAKAPRRSSKKTAKKATKKSKVSPRSKPKAQSRKMKKVSIGELFDLKKARQEKEQRLENVEQIIPPHELDEKVHLQPKPLGNQKIG